MFRYIKMDLYKLLKSKFFYICMIVFLALIALSVVEIRDIEKDVLAGREVQISDSDTYYTTGIGPNAYKVVGDGINLKNLINMTYGGNMMLLMALITLVLLLCSDYSAGYIKNTIVIPKYRWYTNISKIVSAFIIMTAENILAVFSYLWCIKFYFKSAAIGEVKGLGQYLAVEMILYLGLAALFIFVCDLTQSKATGISLGVLVSCQLVGTLIMVLIGEVFNIKPKTTVKLIISFVQSDLMAGMSRSVCKEALILGGVALLVYTTFANIVVSKKDY